VDGLFCFHASCISVYRKENVFAPYLYPTSQDANLNLSHCRECVVRMTDVVKVLGGVRTGYAGEYFPSSWMILEEVGNIIN
jgi:hypothetical protein